MTASNIDCLFCQIALGKAPAAIIDEDPRCVVFQDISPQAPVHLLSIPRQHYSSLQDIQDPDLIGHLVHFVMKSAEKKNIKQFRLVVNCGSQAGQTISHAHVHLMAGRTMHWPPG